MAIVPSPANTALSAHDCMRAALQHLAAHHIDPTPQNYAVWYFYASQHHPELTAEIDQHIAQKIAFTPAYNAYLYSEFVNNAIERKALQDATANVQRHLLEVLKLIANLSGETEEFNTQMDRHVRTLGTDQNAGASLENIIADIVSKATTLKNLGANMKGRLDSSKEEVDLLKQSLAKITLESQRDFLTGVANRKAFDKALLDMAEHAKDTGAPLSLMMIDIDHFKRFNDRFGHLLGDEVLKIVAKSLVDCVKGKDLVARYGGEEFAVLLPDTPPKGGMVVAESIRTYISQHDIKRRDTGGSIGTITVSVGVTLYRPGETIEAFIERADKALYSAKHGGRNQVAYGS